MNSNFLYLLIITSFFSLTSCEKASLSQDDKLALDPRYKQINEIKALADCIGPQGKYTNKISSSSDGSLLFTQVAEYRDEPFIAQIDSDGIGYTKNPNKKLLDTLSKEAIEMIRSHDFHRMQTNPKDFFKQIKYEKDLGHHMKLYSAIDALNHPVEIAFDTQMNQIKTIELQNMMDTTESISIKFKKWMDSDYGLLAKKIEIIQAKKDTFQFNFQSININEL